MIKKNLLRFLYNIKTKNYKRIYVAYSGGLDSTVLLHALYKINLFKISALHINHNISNYSNLCEKQCEKFASNIGINLNIRKILLKNKKQCLESDFRLHRYKSFFKMVKKESILLLAHHAQDQIETYLFRLFKGSGNNGLSSIKPISNIFNVNCVRPLLIFNKEDIYKYAVVNNLTWCEDPANKNTLISRNYIRYYIYNNIVKFWPMATRTISRSIKLLQIQDIMINKSVKSILIKSKGLKKNTININFLLSLEIDIQFMVLRHWIKMNKIKMPTFKQLKHLYIEVVLSRTYSNSKFYLNNVIIKKYNYDLFMLNNVKYNKKNFKHMIWNSTSKIVLYDGRKYITDRFKKKMPLLIKFKYNNKKVKKIMQKNNVPIWERKTTPLIFKGSYFMDILYQSETI